jgi:hypothetical protein
MTGMDDSLAILLDFYKENRVHGRQHETQRQLLAFAVVALVAALLSAIAALKFYPATLLLCTGDSPRPELSYNAL